jgi:16S rRNA (guanine527-N7)-methyltransferase
VHLERIAELLAPFLMAPLADAQLAQLAAYLEILHRWNARMNLTAIKDPEQVVTRHFGESLFAAQRLFPGGPGCPQPGQGESVVDIGSGAGFPGLPIKIWQPELQVWLLESQSKKATFLKEVVRALDLQRVSVMNVRAEQFDAASGPVAPGGNAPAATPRVTITLRAVEKFDRILPIAAQLAGGGRLALLIGALQVETAHKLTPGFRWSDPLSIPQSLARVLLVGEAR